MRARVRAEPGLGVDAIELGRLDQGAGDGGGATAGFGADEEVILPAKGHAAHGAFRRVVVNLQDAVLEVGAQPGQPHEGMPDGGGQGALAREAGQLRGEPGFEVLQDWSRLGVAQADPLLRRLASGGWPRAAFSMA